MVAEIICVGTELLLGDIVNTNAQFLSRELAELGITVLHQHVVGDNPARLEALVREAAARSDLLVLSGGLGPTADDLTKETVAAAFGDTLHFDEEEWGKIPPRTTANRPWSPPGAARSPTPTAPPPAPGSGTKPAAWRC